MKCFVCFLYIVKCFNYLGCMGSIIFMNIFDSISFVRSDVIYNMIDNFLLFVSYFMLVLF